MFDFLETTNIDLENDSLDTSNWQRIFFDLEGSLTTQGDIIQLAAITTDWGFKITGAFNMYFKNRKPIDEKELRVHGITEKFLENNASIHFTEALELTPLYPKKSTMFISYTTFDIKRIQEELRVHNLPLLNFGTEKFDLATNLGRNENCYFNAFRYGKQKGVKLSEDLGEEVFEEIYRELAQFGNFESKGNHDALYDSVMILALCRRLSNDGTYNSDYRSTR